MGQCALFPSRAHPSALELASTCPAPCARKRLARLLAAGNGCRTQLTGPLRTSSCSSRGSADMARGCCEAGRDQAPRLMAGEHLGAVGSAAGSKGSVSRDVWHAFLAIKYASTLALCNSMRGNVHHCVSHNPGRNGELSVAYADNFIATSQPKSACPREPLFDRVGEVVTPLCGPSDTHAHQMHLEGLQERGSHQGWGV